MGVACLRPASGLLGGIRRRVQGSSLATRPAHAVGRWACKALRMGVAHSPRQMGAACLRPAPTLLGVIGRLHTIARAEPLEHIPSACSSCVGAIRWERSRRSGHGPLVARGHGRAVRAKAEK